MLSGALLIKAQIAEYLLDEKLKRLELVLRKNLRLWLIDHICNTAVFNNALFPLQRCVESFQ